MVSGVHGGLTDYEREVILRELEKGATKAAAIAVAGVHKENFVNEYNTNEEFRKAVDERYIDTTRKITPELRAKFLENLKMGMSFRAAAADIGIYETTMVKYCSRNPEYYELVKVYLKKYSPSERVGWISYDQRQVLIEMLRKGFSRKEACKQAGVSLNTLLKYIARDEEIRNAITEAEIEACEKVENALYKSALEGNFQAQRFWLCNRAPDRWKDVSSRSSRDSGSTSIEVHVKNVFEDIDRLALEYEKKFNEVRARGLAPSNEGSESGGSGHDRLQGDGSSSENDMGEPVHTTYTVSPAA